MIKIFVRVWLVLLLALACIAADAPGYKVTKKYPIPGDGGFDYIVFDGSSNRLYVSHGTKVNSGKVLGNIENTPGVHGTAIVSNLHRGLVTDGGNATVTVFDTNSLKSLKTISVDKDPDFVFYDPQTKRVFVCHGDAAEITAIDPEKEEVVGKITLGGGAEAAVVDEKGNGFVNLEELAEVANFDPRALTVKQKWPITGCKTPTGLAIDSTNRRLFIGCRDHHLLAVNMKVSGPL